MAGLNVKIIKGERENKKSQMNLNEFEGLLEELEKLREDSEEIPIIVEGPRDVEALRCLGVEGEFFQVSGTPFYELCERITKGYSEVILFTDTDKAGQRLAKRLKSYFSQRGVKVRDKYRLTLLSRLDTHQVENLPKRLYKVERQFYRF
jgi:5S rRNA maturation endonuclease (ribonuclease M5)